jgi:hypothetical protein
MEHPNTVNGVRDGTGKDYWYRNACASVAVIGVHGKFNP